MSMELKLWNDFSAEISNPEWQKIIMALSAFSHYENAAKNVGLSYPIRDKLKSDPHVSQGIELYLKLAALHDQVLAENLFIQLSESGKDLDIVKQSGLGGPIIGTGALIMAGIIASVFALREIRKIISHKTESIRMDFGKWVAGLPPDKRNAIIKTTEYLYGEKLSQSAGFGGLLSNLSSVLWPLLGIGILWAISKD